MTKTMRVSEGEDKIRLWRCLQWEFLRGFLVMDSSGLTSYEKGQINPKRKQGNWPRSEMGE